MPSLGSQLGPQGSVQLLDLLIAARRNVRLFDVKVNWEFDSWTTRRLLGPFSDDVRRVAFLIAAAFLVAATCDISVFAATRGSGFVGRGHLSSGGSRPGRNRRRFGSFSHDRSLGDTIEPEAFDAADHFGREQIVERTAVGDTRP